MTGPICIFCQSNPQWCPTHGVGSSDPAFQHGVRMMLAALMLHDQAIEDKKALGREIAKDRLPMNSGRTGMQVVTTDNTEGGNEAQVFDSSYDARPWEGCEGVASLHVRVRDVTQTNPGGRQNSKLMLRIRCATGVSDFEYPSVDATKGARVTIPGSGSITVNAFMVAANASVLVQRATVEVLCAIAWGGSSQVGAFQTMQAVTLAGPGFTSAFVRIPDQARFAMASTTVPGRSGALQMDFATDNAAADIRYSILDPVLNTSLIHSGVEWFRFVGDIAQDVTAAFETN